MEHVVTEMANMVRVPVTKKRSPQGLRGLKAMSTMRMSQYLANQRIGKSLNGDREVRRSGLTT